jgi:hypothetical protein
MGCAYPSCAGASGVDWEGAENGKQGHEILEIAGAEAVATAEGNMCGAVMARNRRPAGV